MATSYKTPGVYVEEIVKFPPSIAQVETAIPAFIGYTEKATKKIAGDLKDIPTKITSMLEYETFFGSALKETDISISVDVIETSTGITESVIRSVNPPAKNKRSPFLMYYSLQMYFGNGGGPCYIVSVGQYDPTLPSHATTVVFDNLQKGLDRIRKVDEPTLLLFPDATSLGGDGDFYTIYINALNQCHDLQDRFTIIDTFSDVEHPTSLSDSEGAPYETIDPITAIRQGISAGKDYVKYGAVYFPFLETYLDYVYDESKTTITFNNSEEASLAEQIEEIADSIDTTDLDSLISDLDDLETSVDEAPGNPEALAIVPAIQEKIGEINTYVNSLISDLNLILDIARTESSVSTQVNALDTWLTDTLEQTVLDLNKTHDRLNGDTTKGQVQNEISSDTTNNPSLRRVLGIHDDNASADQLTEKIDVIVSAGGVLRVLIDALPSGGPATPETRNLSEIEVTDNSLYNKIKVEIGLLPVKLPPSSTMAGIYAKVDSNRGVWKAPANIGVNYVQKPSVAVSHESQRDLNVDTVAGKSINAIRTFTGKGILVWGARTLAGNDNEWRYISVRRFFNMAEESIKKGTEQFVFEPNDANTWILVKAMISNFLTNQWKAGALAGPTPEKAFYVKVGLGETMTADDILNGYMNIEIGMAVVRPAEFIILKFSHKMQEA